MGMSRLDRIAASLLAEGKDPHTPTAVVQYATQGLQHTLITTLRDLPRRAREEGLAAPALIFIGSVVGLRTELSWFEGQPLFGKRFLVTRPRHQAGDMVHRLLELGAIPFVLPTVEIRAPDDWSGVDEAIRGIKRFDWIVFTSANGVNAFLGRLKHLGFDLRALGHVLLAAIGPKTAETLRGYHLQPDVMPARFQSEDFAAELRTRVQPGQRVLLAALTVAANCCASSWQRSARSKRSRSTAKSMPPRWMMKS